MKNRKRVLPVVVAVVMMLGALSLMMTQVVNAATIVQDYKIDKIVYGGRVRYEPNNVAITSPDSNIRSGSVVNLTFTVIDDKISDSGSIDPAKMQAYGFALSGGNYYATTNTTVTAGGFSSEPVLGQSPKVFLKYTITVQNAVYDGNGKELGVEGKLVYNGNSHNVKLSKTIVESVIYVAPSSRESSSQDDEEDDETNTDPATPYIIISAYNAGSGALVAGQEFPLSITFYNTSSTLRVENMIVSIKMPESLSLVDSSNTFYVTSLDAKTSQSKTFNVFIKPNARPEGYAIDVEFKYQYIANKVRKDGSTNESINLRVEQVDRFTVNPLDLPPEIAAEEEYPLSVGYINKGRSDVYNMTVAIAGTNLKQEGQQQNLGNLEPGKSGTADFFIQCQQPGPVTGTITFTYEDLNMNVKTVTVDFSLQAVEAAQEEQNPWNSGPPEVPVAEGANKGWMIWAGIGAAMLAVAGFFVIKRIKARKEQEDDEDI